MLFSYKHCSVFFKKSDKSDPTCGLDKEIISVFSFFNVAQKY